MKNKGYYDLLLNKSEKIEEDYFVEDISKTKNNNLDLFLLKQFNKNLLNKLSAIKNSEEKIIFLNKILDSFSQENFSDKVLLKVGKNLENNYVSNLRLSDNFLFTNSNQQRLIEQFNQEFVTSDSVLLIYPFISKSMLNKLKFAFDETKKNNINIKIITTTFDNKAMFLDLIELEKIIKKYDNIKIKIEDNSQKSSERIHIKAAIFNRNSGFSTIFLGSSNLTYTGFASGREWNLRINQFDNQKLYEKFILEFNDLWNDNLLDFNNDILRKDLLFRIKESNKEVITFKPYFLYDFQIDILNKIKYRRKINKNKHLVIMATGTGKTVVSAFDYLNQIKNLNYRPKILFLAHQKEIVTQALKTFRLVLQDDNFGTFLLENKDFKSNYMFATIQTVHRNLDKFEKDQFQLIIFDEAHHIAAKTFDQVFNYFIPSEIIGLTATPEREDGKSILPYFDNEFAYELRIWDAINQRLLSKFDYYCIDDEKSNLQGIDLEDDSKLFKILNNDSRNKLLLKIIENYIGVYHQPLALVFCINVEHAEIVSNFLNSAGLKASFLTNKVTNLRNKIINDFKNHKINYLCVVNIFNEGIDIPEIDTIILLRPTSSKTVYLQQLGRGLRKTNDKNNLVVFDLISNIDQKYDVTVGIKNLYHSQGLLNPKDFAFNSSLSLPYGCTITLEPKSKEIILSNLKKWYEAPKKMYSLVHKYYEIYGNEGLKKIIEDYDLNLLSFYNSLNDFYLKVAKKIITYKINENDFQRNKNILKQFLFLNDYEIVNYFYLRLKEKISQELINYHYDNLLICSLLYEVTSFKVFNKYFSGQEDDLIIKFITENKLITEELLIILKYKLENENLLTSNFLKEDFTLLKSKSTFTVRQALCAINRVNFIKHLGPLKIIAFQAGYLTFDNNKTVVFADIGGESYGKKTRYAVDKQEFYWSIPETKTMDSKLVTDLSNKNIIKLLFLNNAINKNYLNLSLKLYDFIGFGQYLTTFNEKFITLKFKIE